MNEDEFKLVVAGGRRFGNYVMVKKWLDKVLKIHPNLVIVSGNAKGADSLGERWADENNLPCEKYPADWNKHGKRAGYIRNTEMAEIADAVIVFWDGSSKGTANMVKIAKELNIPVKVVRYK
jgi:hypothetical protein